MDCPFVQRVPVAVRWSRPCGTGPYFGDCRCWSAAHAARLPISSLVFGRINPPGLLPPRAAH